MNKKVKIITDFIKLDQLLKYASVVQTGGEAKDLIFYKKVKVNGDFCVQRGKKIRVGDIVEVLDCTIEIEE